MVWKKFPGEECVCLFPSWQRQWPALNSTHSPLQKRAACRPWLLVARCRVSTLQVDSPLLCALTLPYLSFLTCAQWGASKYISTWILLVPVPVHRSRNHWRTGCNGVFCHRSLIFNCTNKKKKPNPTKKNPNPAPCCMLKPCFLKSSFDL